MSDLENLKPLAIELGTVIEEIKNLTAKKKMLEEQLRPAISARGDFQFGDFQFKVTESPGRKTLDKNLMIADGIDPEKYMKTGAPFTTMTCKRVQVV